MKPERLGLTRHQLDTLLDEVGIGARHTKRVFRGLHFDHLELEQIEGLGRHAATLSSVTRATDVEVTEQHPQEDGTTRLVLRFADGARIESVLVPMAKGRWTLCVSSQVGCAMACTFCATGTLGLTRHLSAAEIVAQVYAADRIALTTDRKITRLVFMGMGEPLHAYESVRDAIEVLNDRYGRSLSTRNITVSTVGLVPRMRQLARETGGRVQLALSLHAGTDETRAKIVPTARRTPLRELRAVLETWPQVNSRKLMFEVVVLPGVNTGPADLDGIAAFVDGLPGVVNLIPFNPFPGAPYRSPTDDEVLAMQASLRERGVRSHIRWPRGRSVNGACGQLMLS